MFKIAGLESVNGCRCTKCCLKDCSGVWRRSTIGLVDHTITGGCPSGAADPVAAYIGKDSRDPAYKSPASNVAPIPNCGLEAIR